MAREKLTPQVAKARQRWLLDVAKRHTEGDLSRLETKTGVNRSILSQYTNGRKDVSDRHVAARAEGIAIKTTCFYK